MAKLELRLRSFIPHDRILFSSVGNSYVYFLGDNRGSSWTGTHRTQQAFTIDTSLSNYGVKATKNVGSTTKHGYVGDKLTSTETKTAPDTGLKFSTEIREDNLFITAECSVGNPVVPSPNIDYSVTIQVKRNGSVTVYGKHDGFPAYELWRKMSTKTNPERIYLHDPRVTGDTILSLGPPMEKSFNASLAA